MLFFYKKILLKKKSQLKKNMVLILKHCYLFRVLCIYVLGFREFSIYTHEKTSVFVTYIYMHIQYPTMYLRN